jgi:cell division initiation protein
MPIRGGIIVAGEKKFGTSMFGFKRSDVNAYIERIIREFDQRLKEKDDENAMLKFQIKELTAKYEQLSQEAEHLIREKEKIAGVLMQAQEKAETMMEEARSRAVEEKSRLDQLLETEKEKIVDIKRDIKNLKAQITGILSRYQQEINETVMNIEQKELYYITEETKDQNENPEVAENENHAIPEDEDKENINNEFEAG